MVGLHLFRTAFNARDPDALQSSWDDLFRNVIAKIFSSYLLKNFPPFGRRYFVRINGAIAHFPNYQTLWFPERAQSCIFRTF